MNKFVLKIGNLKEITKKLNKNQKKILNKNVCNPTLKYFLVNAAMINFKGTHSKLFWNPCVQIEKLENWLPKYMEKTNKPKRNNETRIKEKLELKSKEKRVQKPLIKKLRVTKKGSTYIKSVETELWNYVKIDMS